jgi:hypothetical protein
VYRTKWRCRPEPRALLVPTSPRLRTANPPRAGDASEVDGLPGGKVFSFLADRIADR